ncbi:hypothetical protein TWF225_003040 [Orbilia oligospora]|nr:hypothetical protein TWF225_003040 [Orbilia oligospora]KAF3244620.1 hypothetical protein TWF128_009709 [Orbilia oligospora]KAF3264862.1 hypothetical protein TWF217_003032 [Orbilia oligospora]KAF3294627.1 hypothetical protein TWF132_003112 [Orbilia oligospora]
MAKTADPKSRQRVILHFDYDCFYASCHERLNPALKNLPLAIQQKQIIVTCNYVARKRGLHKLQLLSEAKRACPDLVVVNGENLDLFRDCSKENFLFLKEYIWSGKIERLGFDEVFMDVTDQIDYNLDLAKKESFKTGFYQLKPDQPNFGFKFDWDTIPGHLYPPLTKPSSKLPQEILDQIPKRLLLATHLAQYLRLLLLDQQGFTCSAGVCNSKLTAKLAGTINKPSAQTLLLPDYTQEFLDDLAVLNIPGIGSKTGRIIRDLVRSRKETEEAKGQVTTEEVEVGNDVQNYNTETFDLEPDVEAEGLAEDEIERFQQAGKDGFMEAYYNDSDVKTKVIEARTMLSRQKLDEHLGNMPPGAGRVWELLHGIDNTEVAKATLVPTQVSIEDTFRSGIVTQDTPVDQLESILARLSITLVRRLKADLLTTTTISIPDDHSQVDISQLGQPPAKKWQAFPKTLRLSTRDRHTTKYPSRNSKSAPMPNFVFSLTARIEETARRLAKEALVPLFKRLHSSDTGNGARYDLALINVAAINMGSGETGVEGGDVAAMFKRYSEVFPEGDQERKRPFEETQRVELQKQSMEEYSGADVKGEEEEGEDIEEGFLSDDGFSDGAASDEGSQEVVCKKCHARLPIFAIGAHERFHKQIDDR